MRAIPGQNKQFHASLPLLSLFPFPGGVRHPEPSPLPRLLTRQSINSVPPLEGVFVESLNSQRLFYFLRKAATVAYLNIFKFVIHLCIYLSVCLTPLPQSVSSLGQGPNLSHLYIPSASTK